MLNDAIDVHSHFLPPAYAAALAQAGLTEVDGGVPLPSWSAEETLRLMDELGIARSILSVSSPFLGFIDGAAACALARAVNKYASNLIARFPGRFGSFALLPLHDVNAAIDEARFALDRLGLDGVALPTNVAGRYLGDPLFAPLLDALAQRGTTVFIHPTSPCCHDVIGLGLPGPMIEFPFDTCRTVVSLLFGGALARHRTGLRFIVPHLGGALPVLIPRIASIATAPYLGEKAIDRETSLALLGDLLYDTAGLSDARQFAALRQFAEPSHILFGTDAMFAPVARIRHLVAVFAALPLDEAARAAISSVNARRVLRLE